MCEEIFFLCEGVVWLNLCIFVWQIHVSARCRE